jgi:hypothetical protein
MRYPPHPTERSLSESDSRKRTGQIGRICGQGIEGMEKFSPSYPK